MNIVLPSTRRFYVYKLIDPTMNQPFYVGKGTGDRMYQHVWYHDRLYETTTHNNQLLKNKIRKVLRTAGKVHIQRYVCRSEQQAFDIEKALIRRYGRRDNKTGILCNMTDGGEGVSGHIRSEQWREQSRRRQINHSRGYDQYTLSGQYVCSFSTLQQVRDTIKGIDTGSLSRCVNNKIRSVSGFRWTWKDVSLHSWNPTKKTWTNPHKGKNFRPVLQYTKDGVYVATFPSMVQAAKSVNKHPNTLLECCKGRSKTAGGFVWKYLAI